VPRFRWDTRAERSEGRLEQGMRILLLTALRGRRVSDYPFAERTSTIQAIGARGPLDIRERQSKPIQSSHLIVEPGTEYKYKLQTSPGREL
jgi:hypothetical protein